MLKQCVIIISNNEVKSNFPHLSSPLLDLYLLQKARAVSSLGSRVRQARNCVGKRSPPGFLTACTKLVRAKPHGILTRISGEELVNIAFLHFAFTNYHFIQPLFSATKSSCQAKRAHSKWPCVLVCVYHIISREFHFQNTRLHNPLVLEIGPGLWIYWSRVPRNKNMSVQLD